MISRLHKEGIDDHLKQLNEQEQEEIKSVDEKRPDYFYWIKKIRRKYAELKKDTWYNNY